MPSVLVVIPWIGFVGPLRILSQDIDFPRKSLLVALAPLALALRHHFPLVNGAVVVVAAVLAADTPTRRRRLRMYRQQLWLRL